MGEFDLGKYWNLFPEALQKRYGSRFEVGFDRIEELYKAVRSGTPHKLTVVETEFALWTWYRRAYGKSSKQRGTHQTEFRRDHWVQERRAKQIADSLGLIDRLDLARSFLDTAPTVAAITAWRESAVKVRNILEAGGKKMTKDDSIWNRIARLPAGNVPQGWTPEGLKTLWWGRNEAMKDGEDIPGPEATRILNGVGKFIEHNTPEPHRSSLTFRPTAALWTRTRWLATCGSTTPRRTRILARRSRSSSQSAPSP